MVDKLDGTEPKKLESMEFTITFAHDEKGEITNLEVTHPPNEYVHVVEKPGFKTQAKWTVAQGLFRSGEKLRIEPKGTSEGSDRTNDPNVELVPNAFAKSSFEITEQSLSATSGRVVNPSNVDDDGFYAWEYKIVPLPKGKVLDPKVPIQKP